MNLLSRKLCTVLYVTRQMTYKSALSLEKLYPNSTLALKTPSNPTTANEGFNGFVPVNQLNITYSRSEGPGGQNVNKVNTKVDVRFHLENAIWLNSDIKAKLLEKFKSRINKDGYIIFRSHLTRSQQLNLADCLEKLRSAIREAMREPATPSTETVERIRKRHEKAAQERLYVKRERSQIKSDRKSVQLEEFN